MYRKSSLILASCFLIAVSCRLSAADLAVGDAAPNFAAKGVDDKQDELKKHIGKDDQNVVLIFSRASW